MAERFKAHDWKSCSPKGVGGSNPPPSAITQMSDPETWVTDVGRPAHVSCGYGLITRAEDPNQPFRRWDGAMWKFSDAQTLQKRASSPHSPRNLQAERSAVLAKSRQVAA